MNRFILSLTICLCILAAASAGSAAEDTYVSPAQAADTYIPSVSLDNYWIMHGGPQLSASLAGTDEFSRGDTVTLYVNLANYGKVMGFEEDKMANNPTEWALANQEQQLESARTNAIGITATLLSDNPLIEVKSGDQVVESLRAGAKTEEPLKFTVKIGKHAPAGKYPLKLKLTYDYQYNVEVYASEIDSSSGKLSGFQTAYWYQKANQTSTILMKVKKEADFEITKVEGSMKSGEKKSEITVTYKNIGEDPVTDAIARLSIFKPFSSTDDQAYIGDLEPGAQKKVRFRLDVDSDATPKEYGVNSEIKYLDVNGDTVISESMKIPVTVEPAARSMLVPVLAVVAVLAAAGGYLYRKRQKKA